MWCTNGKMLLNQTRENTLKVLKLLNIVLLSETNLCNFFMYIILAYHEVNLKSITWVIQQLSFLE